MTNFIRQDYLTNKDICDDLIGYFKDNKNKNKGKIGSYDLRVDEKVKKSIDVTVKDSGSPIILNYLNELQIVLDNYVKEYTYSNHYSAFSICEFFNIQYYNKGDAFYGWHTERVGANCNRHLVFMTYLNDVEDQGETEFYHQKLKVKPRKGLTLIWPADWTHTHRGIPSPTQEKYILTGWFSFVDKI
jgi:hypothetical protein